MKSTSNIFRLPDPDEGRCDAAHILKLFWAATRPGLGVIEPCLPSPAKAPPSGPGWLHEIKHDGFRILARKDAAGVRLITRHGNIHAYDAEIHPSSRNE
jgi:hypothetical protein